MYLSGSAAMIRATLARLIELEVPGPQIWFDAFGEQADIYLGLKRQERAAKQRKVLSSGEKLPQRQASKSSATSSEVGNDWQVSTKPPLFSSGSRA